MAHHIWGLNRTISPLRRCKWAFSEFRGELTCINTARHNGPLTFNWANTMAAPIPAPIKRIAQIINHQAHPSEPATASAAINNAKRIHTEMVEPAVTRAEAAEARVRELEAELEAAEKRAWAVQEQA